MSGRRLCEGGVEIGTGPCAVCGRTWQENCGRPLPDPRNARIIELEAQLAEVQRERDAIRELMNCYNLGGWTDALEPMKRALEAEAQLAECERERDKAIRRESDLEAKTEADYKIVLDSYADENQRFWERIEKTEAERAAEKARADRLEAALSNLYALVKGEAPSLLEDDHHDLMVREALEGK